VLTSTVWSLYTFSKCQWRQWVTHLCSIRTSMSDIVVSDHPSAAICHTATTWNGMLVGRFSLDCHPTNIHPDVMGQQHKTAGITFRVALVRSLYQQNWLQWRIAFTSDLPLPLISCRIAIFPAKWKKKRQTKEKRLPRLTMWGWGCFTLKKWITQSKTIS